MKSANGARMPGNILECADPGCFTCMALYEIEVVGMLSDRNDHELIPMIISHCKPAVEKYIGVSEWVAEKEKRKPRNDKSAIFTVSVSSGPMMYKRIPPYWCICVSVTLHSLKEGQDRELVCELWSAMKPLKPLLLGAGEEIGYLGNATEVDAALAGNYHRQIIFKS